MRKSLLLILFLCALTMAAGFSGPLKQSTATTVLIGPFVDSTDGVTAEDALDVTTAGFVDRYIGVTKADITVTAADGDNDMVHVANGYYSLELTDTDTGTVGPLTLTFNIAGAVPFSQTYDVQAAAFYDAGHSTTLLTVNTTQIEGLDATNQLGSSTLTADAVKTAIEADNSKLDKLYDDWLDGGRLDLIVDGVKAKTDTLPASGGGRHDFR